MKTPTPHLDRDAAPHHSGGRLLTAGITLTSLTLAVLVAIAAATWPDGPPTSAPAHWFAPVDPPENVAQSPRYTQTRALTDEMDAMLDRLATFGQAPPEVPEAADAQDRPDGPVAQDMTDAQDITVAQDGDQP